MKKQDFIFIGIAILFFLPFFVFGDVFEFYKSFNHEHGMIMAFIKFAILATVGEVVGLRIKTGKFNHKGFGILPRIFVWGFIGLTIKLAFIIFVSGVPQFLAYMGMTSASTIMKGGLSLGKVEVAFCISATLNIIYAPVMMTFHKVTDTHIVNSGGALSSIIKPIPFSKILKGIDWNVQWNFVLKKTIPFFWIPAHTITFLLPADYQVLFAALLGIALGVILAIAAQMGKK